MLGSEHNCCIDFENLKLSVHRLDWQFDQKTELILDGYIIGPGQSDSSNREFEIPVKWTFAKKNDQISHWLQLAYKRNSRSDLEISFQPEKTLLSFEGEKVNLTDLKNLIGTGSLSYHGDILSIKISVFYFTYVLFLFKY